MVEVQCSSCHTRYRVDERVLPEGTPTFKCSRCGHVFTIEPRRDHTDPPAKPKAASRSQVISDESPPLETKEPLPPAEAAIVDQPKPQTIQPAVKAEAAEPPPSVPEMASSPSQAPEPPTSATAAPKPARPKISTAELLSRPLSKPSEASEGENLAFDFNSEDDSLDDDLPAPAVEAGKDQRRTAPSSTPWTVGTDPAADLEDDPRDFAIEEPPQPALDRPPVQRGQRRRRANRDEFVDETEAPVYNAGVLHSARFFLGLLMLVLIGFTAATISIHAAPAAARSLLHQLPAVGDRFASPLTPARMVVLHDVHSSYQRGKDSHPFLVIEGRAENVTTAPLNTIGIAASLEATPGKPMSRREVYCGNNLATRTLAAMTPHEIDFFQSLPPAATFKVEPSTSCSFVIVFTQPVPTANHFALVITRAATGVATAPNS